MYNVCYAGHGSIRSILDDMKLLSTEAEGVNVAISEADRPLLVNSAGRVGALLGLKAAEAGEPRSTPKQLEQVSQASAAAAQSIHCCCIACCAHGTLLVVLCAVSVCEWPFHTSAIKN